MGCNLLSTKQVAHLIRRSQGNVNKEIWEGRLKATKIGKTYIVEYGDLLEYCRTWRGAEC
jgi:excisionase family DNA binding protein